MDSAVFVIADPHLGTVPGDVDQMIMFIHSLDAGTATLIFLGDLFHVWVGPPRYHTAEMKRLFTAIQRFRNAGGIAHLVVGNRDALLPNRSIGRPEKKGLPFDTISREYLDITHEHQKIVAFHGDTVNQSDIKYLKWRRLIRHPLFELLFKLLPAVLARRIILNLEKKLKQTNLAFKREFPKMEWERFALDCQKRLSPDLLIVGHFHPEDPIEYKSDSMAGVVVPDWHNNQTYMVLRKGLSPQFERFQAS